MRELTRQNAGRFDGAGGRSLIKSEEEGEGAMSMRSPPRAQKKMKGTGKHEREEELRLCR
jgi:hypothetical protein